MKTIRDLNYIFEKVHNKNSTATMPPEFEFEESYDTWLDKHVLKWF